MTVDEAIARIRAWGEARDWSGYDPYDGLNSPLAKAVPSTLGRRVLTQAVKLSPINLRPVLGIRPERNQKAIALVASGYALLDEDEHAARWLSWLERERDRGWGYNFPVQTRVFRYERGTPNAIATSFAIRALLDGGARWAATAHDAASFLVDELFTGSFFRYLPGEDELVHNANLLAAAAVARTGRATGDTRLLEAAANALPATLTAQASDGSWPYGARHSWIDNFHTGYVLESLAQLADLHDAVVPSLLRGLRFWAERLFEPDGTPRYDVGRTYPIDAHNHAQAIETWVAVAPWRDDAEARAARAAFLLVETMLHPSGYVRFQRRRLWRSDVPYIRWTTAPAFAALTAYVRLRDDRAAPRSITSHARLG